MSGNEESPKDFIRQEVEADKEAGRYGGEVKTRFPPEPNGYLHIGHCKSIVLNFGLAAEHGGVCHLRFDDTNPLKEEQRYIDAMKEDIRWLGYDWGEHEYYASDYYERLYEWAVRLVREGKAYVDELSPEEIREYRGTLTDPGRDSPHRDRDPEESLDLLERMRAGEFDEGERVLRAKIDMAHPNPNLRDPIMYRILHAQHPRTGDAWCIYPTYDWAHGQSDSIEGITHSICTLEFENHRPLYDWFLEQLDVHHPRQIEFARLELTHTLLSKRKLLRLVEEGHVGGWDDPRMPTVSGMRRRGYTPEAIRAFCESVGVAKSRNLVQMSHLEHYVRDDLNKRALRVAAVLDPLKVVITNWPEGKTEMSESVNNPEDPSAGTRQVPFSGEIWIERKDFMEDPPKKFFRLAPGREVRLRYAYWITCQEVVKDDDGEIVELRCTYDPETKGGEAPPDGRKVKGTLHWVSAQHALDAEVRLYEHLTADEDPARAGEEGEDEDAWLERLNPQSLEVVDSAKVEPSLADAQPGDRYQFERIGYFCVDPESAAGRLVFNRTATLRDTWAKIRKRQG